MTCPYNKIINFDISYHVMYWTNCHGNQQEVTWLWRSLYCKYWYGIWWSYYASAQRAGGIYVSVLSVRPSVTFLPASITDEPLDGISWNYSIILSTSKWNAELFFRGRPIQDGRLTAIYGRNLSWAIITITNEPLKTLGWNCSMLLST